MRTVCYFLKDFIYISFLCLRIIVYVKNAMSLTLILHDTRGADVVKTKEWKRGICAVEF